jgi:transposase-like protein
MPKSYPPEFRRRVLDLVRAGKPVAQIAADVGVSQQAIYTWRKQEQIDSGERAGLSSSDHAELVAARQRIAQLEAELGIAKRTADLLKREISPKGATRRSQ